MMPGIRVTVTVTRDLAGALSRAAGRRPGAARASGSRPGTATAARAGPGRGGGRRGSGRSGCPITGMTQRRRAAIGSEPSPSRWHRRAVTVRRPRRIIMMDLDALVTGLSNLDRTRHGNDSAPARPRRRVSSSK